MFILKCMTICTLCIEDSVFIIYKAQPSLIKNTTLTEKDVISLQRVRGAWTDLDRGKGREKPHNYLKNDKKIF